MARLQGLALGCLPSVLSQRNHGSRPAKKKLMPRLAPKLLCQVTGHVSAVQEEKLNWGQCFCEGSVYLRKWSRGCQSTLRSFYSLRTHGWGSDCKWHTDKNRGAQQPAWFPCGQRRNSSICVPSSGQMGASASRRRKYSIYRVKQMVASIGVWSPDKIQMMVLYIWTKTGERLKEQAWHTSALPPGKIWAVDSFFQGAPRCLSKCHTGSEASVNRNEVPDGKYRLLLLP